MSFNFVTYMRTCAENLAEVRHSDFNQAFFRVSGIGQLDEMLGNLSKIKFPAILVHDNTEGTFADRNTSNNYLDTPYFVFYVVQHVKHGDYNAAQEAKENCKAIGKKILARMLRDKRKSRHGLLFLDFRNIPYTAIGPIGDNCYGTMFSFTVSENATLTMNSGDWDDYSA
jgi:hypothetical protein